MCTYNVIWVRQPVLKNPNDSIIALLVTTFARVLEKSNNQHNIELSTSVLHHIVQDILFYKCWIGKFKKQFVWYSELLYL